ncbi:MAG: hypothetical protein H6737_19810 [Alphaproteobacteria bacterium]|nr:hypothetical protein [Alphaproteobacteria bacterium]
MRTLALAALIALGATSIAEAAVIPEASQASVSTDAAWRAHLASQRRIQIERLKAYAEAGVFPLNTTQPGLLSQLLDGTGRPCAMAHLIRESGNAELVAARAARDNAIELADVRRGPIHDWILTSGLTREEVAFVQEPDFFIGEQPPIDLAQLEQERLRTHFLSAARQLELDFDAGVETALERLGKRRLAAPPA